MKGHFPHWDFPELLICYRAHFYVLETVEIVCVAISFGSNYKMTGLLCLLACARFEGNLIMSLHFIVGFLQVAMQKKEKYEKNTKKFEQAQVSEGWYPKQHYLL